MVQLEQDVAAAVLAGETLERAHALALEPGIAAGTMRTRGSSRTAMIISAVLPLGTMTHSTPARLPGPAANRALRRGSARRAA